jgi:hypothetical protein
VLPLYYYFISSIYRHTPTVKEMLEQLKTIVNVFF